MDVILTTARNLELEVNEDNIEELIMGHEDDLTIEKLQEILNEEQQETQRNVSPSEQDEDERGPMPTSAIKDLLKKWDAVRAMVLEWHPNQADVSRVGDLYNDNAINYFLKILKKERKAIDIGHVLQRPISKKWKGPMLTGFPGICAVETFSLVINTVLLLIRVLKMLFYV
ncbi:uncharacterized protein TNCV_3323121 [Trichonephila clavipes]|nr:uncharacterized protein TNCV_3323121 [Trichonephila clavipes]